MRRLFKTRRRAFYTGLFVTYVLTMLFGGCASKLILYPSRQPIDPQTARQVLIPTGPNRVVETWVDRSPGAGRASSCSKQAGASAARRRQSLVPSATRSMQDQNG